MHENEAFGKQKWRTFDQALAASDIKMEQIHKSVSKKGALISYDFGFSLAFFDICRKIIWKLDVHCK